MTLESVTAALAGRYAVEREIGSGGMATVYLAFDERHERHVAIKVLRPRLGAALGAERFLREIRIAASLSHPNIVPLYDSGEADGLLYFVMPFVASESLRARLEREKQLPLDTALEIASQVGAGLTYAHERGIVHRDIKPDNILLSSGQAVVADFGLARAVHAAGGDALTQSGVSLGTPSYMSPEQAGGLEADERSDQYALACTLFEMLAGEPPFAGRTVQALLARKMTETAPDVAAMRDVVPRSVADALRRSLSRAPADRYATVSDFNDALRAGTHSADHRRQAVRVGARKRWLASAAAVVVLVATVFLLGGSGTVAFDERDWILIADFDNQTDDTLFDGTLDQALAIGLRQSQHVNVFPRSGIAGTLAQMGRADSAGVDEATAREVAQRRNVRVVVVPTVSRLGGRYILAVNVVDPADGNVLASRTADAEGPEQVLDALDELARGLRRDLGEPLFSRLRRNVGLDQATTPSLEALRAWTAANRQWSAGQLDAAGSLYQRAVALDSGFAMAHLDLGQYYYWRFNDRERGDVHFEKARSLTDRVTGRERLIIEARSAGWQGNGERAVDAYTILLADYPDDAVSWTNLGYELLRMARWEQSIDAYVRALALDSLNDNALVNLATVYGAAGQLEESIASYARAFELNPSYRTSPTVIHEYGFALVALGRFDEAEEVFRRLLSENRELQSRGNRALASLRTHRGQYDEAIEHLRRSLLLDETVGPSVTALRNRTYLASALLTRHGPASAKSALIPALGILDSSYIEPVFLATLGKLFARAGEVDTARTVLELLVSRVGENDDDRAAQEFLEGEVALAEGNTAAALTSFERAAILPRQPSYVYLGALAGAQIAMGQSDAARSTLEQIVAGRSDGRESQEPWVLAHYELALLHDANGDSDSAIDMYARFLNLWDQADDGLAPVDHARQRLAELTQTDRSR
ncbi:MAG TPA: protein kinase [Longimicrobiales bacterium]|nr:protein kinase [Longimicrobiales bacterium]